MPDGGVTIRASILSGLWICLADVISPPKVSVLYGTRPGGGLRSLLYPQRWRLVTVMIPSIRQALHCGRYAVSAITLLEGPAKAD